MLDGPNQAQRNQTDGPARGEKLVRTRTAVILGYGIIAAAFGGFGTWAFTAPLSGAAIASGSVAVSQDNQIVQHLEGGIVTQIHVREGERVTRGTPLFTFDSTPSETQVARLAKRQFVLRARLERLRAEREQADQLDFMAPLIADAEALDLRLALDEQKREFDTRRLRYRAETSILAQRIEGLNEAIIGLEAQLNAVDEQIQVLQGEGERRKQLLDQGLSRRSDYSEILQNLAALVGQRGAVASEIAGARISILEAREQVVRQETGQLETAINQINELSVELEDVTEQLNLNKAILERTIVRAPSDAYVVQLAVKTPGAVARPGVQLAELLPTDTELGISARVSLADIDVVRPGLPANLRFPALNQRTTPEVPGMVTYVSPDSLIDEVTREPYYEVRLAISALPEGIEQSQIYPGMPVDALITTDARTFAEYVMRPILDSLSLAFREQ